MLCMIAACDGANQPRHALVLLSDFGTTERFVASMKGVALGVDPNLQVHDLTHQIEPFNIWQASYVLSGTIEYWPKGTVFVSVIDPGVGTSRKSVVAETATGHYIVTPDNGSLTLVADKQGIVALREIDENVNRRPGTDDMHTFHGRDVYAYTGARLASGVIDFEGVGPALDPKVVRLGYQLPKKLDDASVIGNIVDVEMPFGNIVTNIPESLLDEQGLSPDKNETVIITIMRGDETVFEQEIPYANSFGYVDQGEPLLYADSLQIIGLAVNSGSFSQAYGVGAGEAWTIRITRSTE
jgi:S-adenosylmethionine hydrolase